MKNYINNMFSYSASEYIIEYCALDTTYAQNLQSSIDVNFPFIQSRPLAMS